MYLAYANISSRVKVCTSILMHAPLNAYTSPQCSPINMRRLMRNANNLVSNSHSLIVTSKFRRNLEED